MKRHHAAARCNALIASKLNQWALRSETRVVVYSLALGRYGALPFDDKQSAEIWLTAAQSFFAIAVLVDFDISVREALVLLVLFTSQVLVEFLIVRDLVAFPLTDYEFLLAFSAVYIGLGGALFVVRRRALLALLRRTAGTVRTAISGG
jgi:cation:H+ antiporter